METDQGERVVVSVVLEKQEGAFVSLTGKKIEEELEAGRIIINPYNSKQLNTNGISYDVTLADDMAVLVLESTVRAFTKAAEVYEPHDLVPAFRLSPREAMVQNILAHGIGKQAGHDHFPTKFDRGTEVKPLPTTIDPRDPPELFEFNIRDVIEQANSHDKYGVHDAGPKLDAFPMIPGVLYLASTRESIGSDYYAPHIHGKSGLARLGLSVHLTAGFGEPGFKYQWTLEMSELHPFLLVPGMRIGQVEFETVQGEIVNYDEGGSYGAQDGPTGSRVNSYFDEDGKPQ